MTHFFNANVAQDAALAGRTRYSRPPDIPIVCAQPVAAQTAARAKVPGDLAGDLKDFAETPSVSGYENQLSEKIRAKLAAFHPVVDNLGDVIVTIGSGSPHRLIVTPIDEPGFVVSGITADGYLRLQRLPQSGLPPIFNELYSAQPVKVRTAAGKWIDGVVAGISVHLHRADETTPSARDIDNMYVDIGATSAAEARAAGVDILEPGCHVGGRSPIPSPTQVRLSVTSSV